MNISESLKRKLNFQETRHGPSNDSGIEEPLVEGTVGCQ